MDRREVILASLSTGNCDVFTPVQVQKLFFLVDKNISERINDGHTYFNFEPYNYGPFDKNVYVALEALSKEGSVEMVPQGAWTSYRLSSQGQKEGEKLLDSISPKEKEYIKNISDLVRKLSFSQLVSAIYKAYPEMKVNSAFQS